MDIKKRAAALQVRIGKEREASGGRVRFTPRLRADVVSFARLSGLSRAELSEQLSLAESILHRWLSTTGAARAKKTIKLRRLKIVDPQPAIESRAAVVFPSGARLEGLSLKQIRALLGGGL